MIVDLIASQIVTNSLGPPVKMSSAVLAISGRWPSRPGNPNQRPGRFLRSHRNVPPLQAGQSQPASLSSALNRAKS